MTARHEATRAFTAQQVARARGLRHWQRRRRVDPYSDLAVRLAALGLLFVALLYAVARGGL